MSTPPAQQLLAYSPLSDFRRLRAARRVRALLLTFVCLTALVASTVFFWRQGPHLYLQHRSLTHTEKPERIVYDSGATTKAADALIASDSRYVRVRPLMSTTDKRGVLFTQQRWNDLIHDVELERMIDSKDARGPLFLHERAAVTAGKRGSNRLVAVELADGRSESLNIWVLDPVTVGWPPAVRWTHPQTLGALEFGGILKTGLQIFAGQADPKDASHFTIRFILGGRPGTIDGWLQADDHVTLCVQGEEEIWQWATHHPD